MKELKEIKEKSENRFSNADWKKSATCHNCGNKGHIKKECHSKKYDNSSRRAFSDGKQDQSQKVKSSNSSNKVGVVGDAGMFIAASICGLGICMLVDTGATLSVLRKEIFEKYLVKLLL